MAGFLYLGITSTGIPRPSSTTVIVRPSSCSVTSMRVAKPLITSSTELSRISQSRWW